MKKKIAVLGATEKTGVQALEVIAQHPDLFEAEILSTHDQADLIIQQAKQLQPNAIVVTDETAFKKVKSALSGTSVKVFLGKDALCDVVGWKTVDLVLIATIGFDSLRPTLAAIEVGKTVAMANNEVLAAAGKLIREKILANNCIFLPVNNGLSSIFQCLIGEDNKTIGKITFAASGGPFLGKKTNFLVNVKKDHALQSPVSVPDEKTAIDTATLMDKGLEMMAAKNLFDLKNEQLEVIVQPQSVIQSMIQFRDGTIKTMLGLPDIRTSLFFALTYPKRIQNTFSEFSFHDFNKLFFDQPDLKTFRSLNLVKEALEKGHNVPCILNAANETMVQAFLNNKVGFMEMTEMIEETMKQIPVIENPTLEDLEKTDSETRKLTLSLTKNSQLFN